MADNKEFIDKNGNTWTWEETPETIEALKQLHKSAKEVQAHGGKTK